EIDHFMWVTLGKGAPDFMSIDLNGLRPAGQKLPDTDEPGSKVKKVPTHPVTGTVTLDGKPRAGATVGFHRRNPETEKYTTAADGLTDETGRFQLSTYTRFDGCPAGEFTVTVVKTGKGYYDREAPEKSLIPEKYATPDKSEIKVTVKEGSNEVNLDLK